MPQSYTVPFGETEVCYEVKKSRFIARLQKVINRDEAMLFLDAAKRDYPDARHHCWAYQLGSPVSPHSAAMSDDGEPSGTAGKPILNVIQHKQVGDVMVIIIRYFGGIKLGAGGLVRAYSHATQIAFDEMKTELITHLDSYKINCGFADEQALRHWLSQHAGLVDTASYAQHVSLCIKVSEDIAPQLKAYVASFKGATIKPSD